MTEILAPQPGPTLKLPRAAAWRHTIDNTEGIRSNGRGIVRLTESAQHPFGVPGEDFSETYPVITERLYTEAQVRSLIAKATGGAA